MPLDRNSPPEQRVPDVLERLKKGHPEAGIALEFSTPLECVVSVVLSAQSTDERVNIVTKQLFRKYRRPEDYLAVPEEELQTDIQSTGFFRQKTRALRGLSQKLIDDFDGEVPRTIAELITLPGVARKSANIIQANCYPDSVASDPDAGIAVDTHVGRLAVRLGFTEFGPKDATKIEKDLMEVAPQRWWPEVTDLLIAHGRTICDAKRPQCGDCVVEPLCPSSQEAGLTDRYRAAMSTTKKRARLRSSSEP
jgi:endonuclease III